MIHIVNPERSRNFQITLDYVAGTTLEELSMKYLVSRQRVHQIVKYVYMKLGLKLDETTRVRPSLQWVGLQIQRLEQPWFSYESRRDPDSPEAFYYRELVPNITIQLYADEYRNFPLESS